MEGNEPRIPACAHNSANAGFTTAAAKPWLAVNPNYKTINAKLVVTKHHLNKIKKHVSKKDQKHIAAQIKAIDVILVACGGKHPRMSKVYEGN